MTIAPDPKVGYAAEPSRLVRLPARIGAALGMAVAGARIADEADERRAAFAVRMGSAVIGGDCTEVFSEPEPDARCRNGREDP